MRFDPEALEREAWDRVFQAACLVVAARVQRALPETQRGIRATEPIARAVTELLGEAFERVVVEATARASAEVPAVEPFERRQQG